MLIYLNLKLAIRLITIFIKKISNTNINNTIKIKIHKNSKNSKHKYSNSNNNFNKSNKIYLNCHSNSLINSYRTNKTIMIL